MELGKILEDNVNLFIDRISQKLPLSTPNSPVRHSGGGPFSFRGSSPNSPVRHAPNSAASSSSSHHGYRGSMPNSPVRHLPGGGSAPSPVSVSVFGLVKDGYATPNSPVRHFPGTSGGSRAGSSPSSPVIHSAHRAGRAGHPSAQPHPQDRAMEFLLNTTQGRKKEDARDGFRQRSWTTDSEASWQSRETSSATSTPDASPMPSPMSKEFRHEFPSPPASPGPHRQRSATLDSIASSSSSSNTASAAVASSAGVSSPPEVAAGPRRRDVNHNNKTSPIKTMFLLAGNSPQPSGDSLSTSSVSSPLEDTSLLAPPGGRRPSASWRKAIFNRVCTPQHSVDIDEELDGKLSNTVEIRAMWKKAILETLLLIRMEKENHHIRARQEEGGGSLSRKLDYEELTPCLKSITGTWETMLAEHAPEAEAETEGESQGEGGDEEEKTEEPEGEERDGDEEVNPRGHDTASTLVPHDRLLDCVRTGVPRELRGQIWLFLMQQRQMSTTVPESACESASYENLLKQLTTHQHAILIDLGRTFPAHPYFSKALGPGQLELFNLLKAYSLLDKEVGYCQGLSFIVGMLLMHMEEISAFHVLKYMMYDLGLRKQFRPNMMALQIKLYQLTRLLHDQYKDLYEHFEMHEISPTLYAAPWFLTLFASQFPLGFVARVFDMMFVQGIDALFKVALMLLGNHRALILQCNSFESTVDFLKTTLPEMVQVQMERIINQAFELDISKELQAYDVEYHVLSEEMSFSPALLPHHHHNHRNSNSHRHHSLPQQHNSPSLQHQAMQHVHHHHHHAHVAKSSLEDRPTRLVDRRRSSIDIEMLSRLEQQNRGLKQQNMDLLEKLQHSQSQQRSYEHSVHAHQIEQDKLRSHVRTLELERAALLSAVAKLRKLVPRAALQNLHLTLPQLPPTTPSPTSSSSSPGFPGSEPESVGPSEEGILSSNVRGDVEAPDGGQKSESRDGNMEKASATFIGDNSAGGLFSSEENTGDLSAKPCSNVEGSSVNTLSGASAEVSSQRGLSSQTTPSGAATTPTIARRPRELSDKNVLSSSSVVSESSLSEQSGPWSTPSMHSSSTGAAQSRNAPRGSGHRDEDNKPAGPRSLPHDAAGSGR